VVPDATLDVWFSLAPGALKDGISLLVLSADGRRFVSGSSNPLTIKRSVCTETAPLEVTFEDVDPLQADYTVAGIPM